MKIQKKEQFHLLIDPSIYDKYMKDADYAHKIIKTCYKENTHLFPSGMSEGYSLNGRKTRLSKKTSLQMHKIKIGVENDHLD